MQRSRSNAFACLTLVAGAYIICYGLLGQSGAGATDFLSASQVAPRTVGRVGLSNAAGQGARTQLAARGGGESAALATPADEENDAIEVGGFSGFLVGLSLLPYVVFCLATVFDVTVGGKAFEWGPYGLEFIACFATVCLTFWSLGSFVQRGRGLPAGPLGLLGLAEGLSYLGSIGLIIAVVTTNLAAGSPAPSGGSAPSSGLSSLKAPKAPEIKTPDFKAPDFKSIKAPEFKAPDFKAPDFKAPDFKSIKAPEFKAPDFKAPEFKAPEFKAPEFKAPDFKAPEFKAPDFKAPDFKSIKVPEVKMPDVKMPEVKIPDVKIPEVKAPEVKAPEAKVKAPEAKVAETPKPKVKAPTKPAPVQEDYSDLFN